MNKETATMALATVFGQGFDDAYIEMMGGGLLAVTVQLKAGHYATIDEIGIGIYSPDWDGDSVPMYRFNEEIDLTREQVYSGTSWLQFRDIELALFGKIDYDPSITTN